MLCLVSKVGRWGGGVIHPDHCASFCTFFFFPRNPRPAGNESDVFVDDNGEEWVDERSALRREREAKLAAIKEKYGYTS